MIRIKLNVSCFKVVMYMTDHSIGEADEGSVGVDGEVGEDRAQGEREASKQEATSTDEDWD